MAYGAFMKKKPATRNLAATFKTEFVDDFDIANKDCSYSKTDVLKAFANWWMDIDHEMRDLFCETNAISRKQLFSVFGESIDTHCKAAVQAELAPIKERLDQFLALEREVRAKLVAMEGVLPLLQAKKPGAVTDEDVEGFFGDVDGLEKTPKTKKKKSGKANGRTS